jgi:hypothetical protein
MYRGDTELHGEKEVQLQTPSSSVPSVSPW